MSIERVPMTKEQELIRDKVLGLRPRYFSDAEIEGIMKDVLGRDSRVTVDSNKCRSVISRLVATREALLWELERICREIGEATGGRPVKNALATRVRRGE